jgi:fumarate hydratase subunit alpha
MKDWGKQYEEAFYRNLVRGVTSVSPDILGMMEKAVGQEDSPAARGMLETLIRNARMAAGKRKGVCQSPGIPCIYVRVGREMAGIDVADITGKAVVRATQEGYLRPSIVHPLTRKNTGNNSGPGIPHYVIQLEPGLDYLETLVSFKGCGPELFNAFKTFTPESLGKNLEGLKRFILEKVIDAGGKPCPPIGLGIGIGGQMDGAAMLSRRAISTRKWDDRNPDPEMDRMERELLGKINQLGIGPGGVGGKTTALAVKIGMAYTHTAICPVAVNFHCWVGRRAGFRFYPDGKAEEVL